MNRKKAKEPRKPSVGADLLFFGMMVFFFALFRYCPDYKSVFLGLGFLMLAVWRIYHARLMTWHD